MVGRKPRRAQSFASLCGRPVPGLSRALRVAALKGRLNETRQTEWPHESAQNRRVPT
jgi:hypothetical protein